MPVCSFRFKLHVQKCRCIAGARADMLAAMALLALNCQAKPSDLLPHLISRAAADTGIFPSCSALQSPPGAALWSICN